MAVVGGIYPLSCTVGLNSEDLNVFLIGNKISERKKELKVTMFTKSQDDNNIPDPIKEILDPTVEIPNLLKYQNVDGNNAPDQDSTYVVVASYKLKEEAMKAKAKKISANNPNCQTIANGDPCVVCFNSSKY